ncbi:metallophosphoesterase family protein [Bacillaceae bacterium W0354]
MNESIRFIHCADLHLDSPYVGLSHLPHSIFRDIKESTFIAFDRLINIAIEEEVDFVLFAGDLFDQQSTSLKSLMRLKRGLEKLNDYRIQAYICFGNHDFGMQQKVDFNFPPNTFIFPSEDVTYFKYEKNGQTQAYIYSFSYNQRAVKENKVNHFKKVDDNGFHIGMLHGSMKSNSEHDLYAPFSIDELKKVSLDYWALGHIHTREILMTEPYAVYPGNIQGRHMKEVGEKGCYLVELFNGETHVTFKPVQTIIFQKDELAFSGINNMTELVEEIEAYKSQIRKHLFKTVVRLDVTLSNSAVQMNDKLKEELIQLLNDYEEEQEHWIWLEELHIHMALSYDRDELKSTNQFVGELLHTIDETEDLTRYFDELLNHHLFRKHIDFPTKEDYLEIKKNAEKIVMDRMLNGGAE